MPKHGWLALGMLAVLGCCTLAPELLAPHDPLAINPTNAFSSPSLAHPFGTDDSGRDVLSRVIAGTRSSLSIGLSATAIGLAAGCVLGVFAGGSLGRSMRPVRYVTDRGIEALFAFPSLLLALLLIAIRGPGVWSIVLATALSTAPGYARLVRGSVRQTITAGPMQAARLQGDRLPRVWLTIVLPEAMSSVLVLALLGIGQAVTLAAALGFLGLGAPPPTPEWGAMLHAGRPYLSTAWWLTFFPGMAILLTGVCCAVLGRALEACRGDG